MNHDYQTWEESVKEAEDPELAGTWADFLVLHDPEGAFPRLRAIAERLSDDGYRRAFERKMDDHVATAMGKIRNAVVCADRAAFLAACQDYVEQVCRALGLLNRRYVSSYRRRSAMASVAAWWFPR